ncbi:hypothetical protein LIER_26263 [Lithospermum erythrorhizon]|uniref:Uncharacterized protein n=1 Tax=Lithospermum erythrorhizon TaxID=34254 RepID=A0AAV3R7Z5_LITER
MGQSKKTTPKVVKKAAAESVVVPNSCNCCHQEEGSKCFCHLSNHDVFRCADVVKDVVLDATNSAAEPWSNMLKKLSDLDVDMPKRICQHGRSNSKEKAIETTSTYVIDTIDIAKIDFAIGKNCVVAGKEVDATMMKALKRKEKNNLLLLRGLQRPFESISHNERKEKINLLLLRGLQRPFEKCHKG